MTDFNTDRLTSVLDARRRFRTMGHLQHAHVMLVAAGLASLGIVAVAAAIMGTLF